MRLVQFQGPHNEIHHVMTQASHYPQSHSNTGEGMALVITTWDELTSKLSLVLRC